MAKAEFSMLDVRASGLTVNEMTRPGGDFRNNSTLLEDEWTTMDSIVVRVAKDKLRLAGDLQAAGMTRSIDGMAQSELTWQRNTDSQEAGMDMDPRVKTADDRPTYDKVGIPLPFIHSDFSVSERDLTESRRGGFALDTEKLANATRKVSEKVEDVLLDGGDLTSGFKAGSYTLQGFLNHDDTNDVSLNGAAWSTATSANMLLDVQDCIQSMIDNKQDGPYRLYIPSEWQISLGKDYTSGYAKTRIARLLELPQLQDIVVLPRLSGIVTDTALMLNMKSDVAQLLDGFPMQVLQWETEKFTTHYKVLTMMLPRIFSDTDMVNLALLKIVGGR